MHFIAVIIYRWQSRDTILAFRDLVAYMSVFSAAAPVRIRSGYCIDTEITDSV